MFFVQNPAWPTEYRLFFNRAQPDTIVEIHLFDLDEFLGCPKLDLRQHLSPYTQLLPKSITLPLGPAADTKPKTAEKIKGNVHLNNIKVPQELWTCKEEIEALKLASGCTHTELVLLLTMQYKEIFSAVDPHLALWTIIAQTERLFHAFIDCGKQFNVIHFDEKEQSRIFCHPDFQAMMKKYFYHVRQRNDGKVSLQDFVITAVRIYNNNEAALASAFFRAFDEDKDGTWTRKEVQNAAKNISIVHAAIAKELYSTAAAADANHLNAGPQAHKLLTVVADLYYSGEAILSRGEAMLKVMARGNPEVVTHDDFVFWYTDPTGCTRLLDALSKLPGNQQHINQKLNEA